ncbi:MAG: U32 family peptidase, partial [Kiritimatiellia bacterium]|nr:U32 family peptidase [Kiritimatiellia bacterium]
TEIFIHGALCYSYSGLCLFSSHQLGRSGNRGRCAYLCRDRFRADTPDATGNERFAFSMKDLALTDALPDLCASGISSLKIEGRMKSPLYVAATTNYYRKRMDGRISPAERKDLESDIQTIFSRPWTPLYIRSRDEKEVIEDETVGHRGATVGIVESVNERGVLRFRTERALELHDGLQIDLPGASRPFGFPIREMRVNGAYAPAFEAAAGSTVEILLPEDRPEIPRGGVLFHASSQKVKQRYPFDRPRPGVYRRRQPVHGAVEVRGDRITARIETDAGDRGTAERVGEFGLAKNPGKTEEAARIAFEKLGDTPFELRRLDVVNPDSLFVPVSQWNELRRQTAADLSVRSTERSDRRIRMIQEVLATPPPMAGTAAFRWSLKVDSLDSLADFGDAEWADLDEVVVDIGRDPIERLVTCLNRLPRERLRLALPMISRSWEIPDLTRKIRDLLQAGCTRWEAANLSAWRLLSDGGPLPDPRIDFSTDWSVYVTNSEAARQALDLGATRFTLSPEDGIDNMRELLTAFGPQATLIVYQDTPLFICESCICSG